MSERVKEAVAVGLMSVAWAEFAPPLGPAEEVVVEEEEEEDEEVITFP